MTQTLHPDTMLGAVHLTISNLSRSVAYYEKTLGLQVHRREKKTAYMGAGREDILVLVENSEARNYPRRTGLYHFAILTPSRLELARVLRNFVETETQLSGWADHLVSEAIYLSDPDGNGIEVYRDRPKEEWPREPDGSLKMANDPLDYQGILAELNQAPEPWEGMHPDTILGHMHLHVAQLPESLKFYEEVVGLETQMIWGGQAGFMSAGGYHHHLGINTWNGKGAPPPPPDATGLRYFEVNLVNEAERGNLVNRLEQAGHSFDEQEAGILVKDPSENGILFVTIQN